MKAMNQEPAGATFIAVYTHTKIRTDSA